MIEATAARPSRARSSVLLLSLALTLAGCAHQPPPQDWRAIISKRDVDRMREWRKAWVAAIAKAREEGNGAAVDAEGQLLDPDAGLDNPMPPGATIAAGSLSSVRERARAAASPRSPPANAGSTRLATASSASPGWMGRSGRSAASIPAPAPSSPSSARLPSAMNRARSIMAWMRGAASPGWSNASGPDRWRLVLPRPPFGGAFTVIELVPGSA